MDKWGYPRKNASRNINETSVVQRNQYTFLKAMRPAIHKTIEKRRKNLTMEKIAETTKQSNTAI